MSIAIITGSAGLVGSESVHFFAREGFTFVGIDNDLRASFFGSGASTKWNRDALKDRYGDKYIHCDVDIRDRQIVENIFREYGSDIKLVIHTAAQPSHDWAAKDPHMDFTVNANGTLVLLEATRQFAPKRYLSLHPRTKFTAIPPIFCPWLNWKRVGRSRVGIGTKMESMNPCQLIALNTRCLGHPRLPPTF